MLIDVRPIRDKRRVCLSNEVLSIMGYPDEIFFSICRINDENHVIMTGNDEIGERIDKSKVDKAKRIVLTKKVIDELKFNDEKFIGFYLMQINGQEIVSLKKIA